MVLPCVSRGGSSFLRGAGQAEVPRRRGGLAAPGAARMSMELGESPKESDVGRECGTRRPPKVRISKLNTVERKRLRLGGLSQAQLEQRSRLGASSKGSVRHAGQQQQQQQRVQDFVNLRQWGRDGISDGAAHVLGGAPEGPASLLAQGSESGSDAPYTGQTAMPGGGPPQLGNLNHINQRLEGRRGAQQVLTDILSAGAEVEQLIENYGKAGMITEALLDVVIARAKLALENDEMEAVGALRLVFKRLQAERRRVNASSELRLLDVLLRPGKTEGEIRTAMERSLLPPDLAAVDLGMDTFSACFAIAEEDGEGLDYPAERVDFVHFCNLVAAMLQGATEDEEGRVVPPERVSEEAYERLCSIQEILHEWISKYPSLTPQHLGAHPDGDAPIEGEDNGLGGAAYNR